jgi:hypothetical protein
MNEAIEKRPEEYAPTLSSSMVLVELHQHVPPFRKLDKKQTAKVNYDANAERDTASVHKKYMKCNELTAVNKVKSDQYKFHIASTIPWLDGGIRGLYNKFYQAYMVEMGGWTELFDEKVDAFMEVYSWEVSQEQARMGAMYDRRLYPSEDQLRRKFGVEVMFLPLAETGDFRCDVGKEGIEVMKTGYDKLLNDRIQTAYQDIYERLLVPVQNMSKMLDYSDGEKPTGFRDTLIPNVESMLEVLRVCNIADDPQMERTRQALANILEGVTCDILRENAYVRSTTKRDLDEIIKSLPTLDVL